jgi:hypothetical protein
MLAVLAFLLAAALVNGQAPPRAIPPGDSLARRTALIKRIAADLRNEDFMEIPNEAPTSRLSQIRHIVEDQVSETLRSSEKPEDVRESVAALFAGLSGDGWKTGFAYDANLQGVKTMVVGYSLNSNGNFGSSVVILGYRKGLTYELVAETHAGGYVLVLDPVASPRPNEAWYLDHGQIRNGGNYAEPLRLFSFDGYEFKNLWEGGGYFPEIRISRDKITVRYNEGGGVGPRRLDSVFLTTGGVVASTTDEPQQ